MTLKMDYYNVKFTTLFNICHLHFQRCRRISKAVDVSLKTSVLHSSKYLFFKEMTNSIFVFPA
jgi:hypothetical protein